MVISRAGTLAALVLAALAAPVTAVALASGPGGPSPHPSSPASTHAAEPEDDASDAPEPKDQETGTPNAHSAAGRAHAAAMKAWAHCVADAASGPKSTDQKMPPKLACGEKPLGPGRAKHQAAGSTSPGHSGDHPRGRGHAKKSGR